MRWTAALALPLLVACGAPDIEGTWEGDCALNTGTAESIMTMSLDLDPADGDIVTGGGWLEDSSYSGQIPITIEGTLDGKDLDVELVTDIDIPTFPTTTTTTTTTPTTSSAFGEFMPTFGIEATVKGDEMEGRCSVSVMGFGIGADITLERQ